jgi:hypothetical protein
MKAQRGVRNNMKNLGGQDSRRGTLVGSEGLNNDIERELRLSQAAQKAGAESVAHSVAPPVKSGSEEFHG